MRKNDFMCINNVIYQIYNVSDFREMRTIVLSLLRTLIPNSAASFMLADHTSSANLLCDPVCFPASFMDGENKYMTIEEKDYSRWMLFNNKAMVIRETELLPEEERMQSTLYKEYFAPYNLHYGVNMSIADNNELLGMLSLYRQKNEGDFTDEEVFMLRCIGEHLNARFYNEYMQTSASGTEDAELMIRLANEYGLTGREVEVLLLIFNDFSNDEIAARLCISTNTLKKHLQNLYRKVGASSRWELMSLKLSKTSGNHR